jgi:cell fate regulator YaaT (PSP1 superfamily)
MNGHEKTARGCPSSNIGGSCAKLDVYNWLHDVQNVINPEEIVEVRFKNTRKDYYRNINGLNLRQGDMVAVEANPGHDIGMVSLTGDLVMKQLKRRKATLSDGELRKIYRIAKPVDLQKWEESIALEHETMLKARKIAEDLKLNMKIGDVEFQGDKTKAIFYYIADERVDFRQLIKLYAETFRIRIEMRQIGAR